MMLNKATLGIAALGVVGLATTDLAEEKPSPALTALSSTTISGYVDTSVIWKIGNGNGNKGALDGIGYAEAPGKPSQAKVDGVNLNIVMLTVEKPLDEAGWAAGYKVDLLFGPDADDYGTTTQVGGDLAIKQAYVALRVPLGNNLDFKIGVYDHPLGYEAFESYKNPNYSHSYGYFLEPAAYTGVHLDYGFTDWLSVFGGLGETPSGFINVRSGRHIDGVDYFYENKKTYYGGITLTAPKDLGLLEGSTLTAGAYNGLGSPNADDPDDASRGDTTGILVSGTMKTPVKGLEIGSAWDYRIQRYHPSVQLNEYAIAAYIVYAGIDKWKLAVRGDYYNSSYNDALYHVTNSADNELFALTTTVDYQLWQNVTTRLEFRWDHDLTGQQNGNGPFGDDDSNSFITALNVVYRF